MKGSTCCEKHSESKPFGMLVLGPQTSFTPHTSAFFLLKWCWWHAATAEGSVIARNLRSTFLDWELSQFIDMLYRSYREMPHSSSLAKGSCRCCSATWVGIDGGISAYRSHNWLEMMLLLVVCSSNPPGTKPLYCWWTVHQVAHWITYLKKKSPIHTP